MRDDGITQHAQASATRVSSERRAGCVAASDDSGDGGCAPACAWPLPGAGPLLLLRRERVRTGMVSVHAAGVFSLLAHDSAWSLTRVLSPARDWWVIEVSVWVAPGLRAMAAGAGACWWEASLMAGSGVSREAGTGTQGSSVIEASSWGTGASFGGVGGAAGS